MSFGTLVRGEKGNQVEPRIQAFVLLVRASYAVYTPWDSPTRRNRDRDPERRDGRIKEVGRTKDEGGSERTRGKEEGGSENEKGK